MVNFDDYVYLLYEFSQSIVELFNRRIIRIYGNYLAQIVLGFAVVLFCIVEFVEAEKGVAVARVCNKAGTQVGKRLFFCKLQKASSIIEVTF